MNKKMKQHIEDAEKHMMDYREYEDSWHIVGAVDSIIDALKESMDATPDDMKGDPDMNKETRNIVMERPFFIDDDGDICDANGWLVCRPARDVWPDGNYAHAEKLLETLNRRAVSINEHGAAVAELVEGLRKVVSNYDADDNGRILRWTVYDARALIAKYGDKK